MPIFPARARAGPARARGPGGPGPGLCARIVRAGGAAAVGRPRVDGQRLVGIGGCASVGASQVGVDLDLAGVRLRDGRIVAGARRTACQTQTKTQTESDDRYVAHGRRA